MARIAARHSHRLELERQRTLLRRQQERERRVLSALNNISLACRERADFRQIFTRVQQELAGIFSFDACSIALSDERPGYARCALLVDQGVSDFVEQVAYDHLAGAVVANCQPLRFRDLQAEHDPATPPVPVGHHEQRTRAWLGVPLLIGNTAIGMIAIQSYQVGRYNQTDQDLLQRMARVIAVALENLALSERQDRLSSALADQVAARTEELAALNVIASGLVERRSLAELLTRALDVVLGLFHLEAGNVRLLDDAREHLVLVCQRGFSPAYERRTSRSPLVSSPIRSVVETGEPIIVSRDWYIRRRSDDLPLEVFPRFECSLILPLVTGSTVIGTLSLFGFTPRSFADHEIGLARSIGNQIAIVVENSRLLDERERQIAELRALGEVGRAASTAHDVRTLLRQVHDALKAFLPLDVFSLVVYDHERAVVVHGLTIDEDRIYEYWQDEPPPPRSFSAHILRTGAGLRFSDVPAEIADHPDLAVVLTGARQPARSWLGVPLRDRDGRIIGLISVQAYAPGVFGPRDEAFLHNVATQVALHIQNMRLLLQRERQIDELEAIGQIGKLVTASYDLDKMLGEIYRVFSDLLGASVFALLICDPASGVITNAVFVEVDEWIAPDLVGRHVTPGSLSHWILTQREPLLFHDVLHQRDELTRRGLTPHPVGPAHPVRSWAGVPVVARDGELIGVLSIQDYRPYRFDSGTIDFLSQVASHISLGVQKVRLFQERERLLVEARSHVEAAERQAHRLELVNRIASVLSARLDQQEILEIAARELVQLFWADHSGTVLFTTPDQGAVVAEYPETGIVGALISLRNNPLIERLKATRRPVVIADIECDPLADSTRERWRAMGITSIVILPLVSRDRVLGSISLDSFGKQLSFSEEELELMHTVATAIATSVENAQLFAAEQEQRRTADTLREMARVLSSSFDPDEVLRLVLGELQKVIAFDTASIMLLDGDQLRLVAARGRVPAIEPRNAMLPLEGSGAGEVARTGAPLRYIAGESEVPWMQLPSSSNILSWIGVPLIARGRVLGVLNIDSRLPLAGTGDAQYGGRVFTTRDMEIARTFANHAALAIENARLYQDSVARVEQELEIARRIQANLFPSQLPAVTGLELAARCLPAQETGGDFYDVVDLGGRVGVIVGDVSGKSLPAAMLMAVARSTARSEARNHATPHVVLAEINRWLVDDVPRNSFVALSYALVDRAHGRLVLASAGQLTPLLRRADGSTCFLEGPPALPLGLTTQIEFGELEIALQPGDTLLFYTDGIVEAHDRRRNLFGFERLERLLQRWGHLPAGQLLDQVLTEVHAFSEAVPTHDDMTIVVVRITGS